MCWYTWGWWEFHRNIVKINFVQMERVGLVMQLSSSNMLGVRYCMWHAEIWALNLEKPMVS